MASNRSEHRPGKELPSLRIGQPFNPFGLFNGIFIPDALVRYRGLTLGAKVVYGRLARYKGEKGDCYPSIGTLAAEVGIGATQARTYVHELKEKRFIVIEERPGTTALYTFLWHEAFVGEIGDKRKTPPLRITGGVPLRKTGGPPLRKTGPPPLRKTGDEESQYEESQIKESQQQQAAAVTDFEIASQKRDQATPKRPSECAAPDDAEFGGAPPTSATTGNGPSDEECPEIRALLDEHCVKVRRGQVQAIIAAGQQQGLTLTGIFAFIRDKLTEKAAQNDPVFSAGLILRAIRDRTDLHRWAAMHSCGSYLERTPAGESQTNSLACRSNEITRAPFSVADLRCHLSWAASQLRTIPGLEQVAVCLDLLADDSAVKIQDLESLEQRLTQLEDEMQAIALSWLREDDLVEMRARARSELDRYGTTMSRELLSQLERSGLSRRIFERFALPRLSLFYLDPHSEQAA